MKANEAPEKIILSADRETGILYNEWVVKDLTDSIKIEYIRKDVFIENACKLLVNCIEDFMARRMEIWNKECKKQTLENLRKALNK